MYAVCRFHVHDQSSPRGASGAWFVQPFIQYRVAQVLLRKTRQMSGMLSPMLLVYIRYMPVLYVRITVFFALDLQS